MVYSFLCSDVKTGLTGCMFHLVSMKGTSATSVMDLICSAEAKVWGPNIAA